MPADRSDVFHGTLALMILKTLDGLGPQHGYGIARRIEQTSGHKLALNQGTLYPALLKLEQMGWISSKWGTSENNRRARFYTLTRKGRKELVHEESEWRRIAAAIMRILGKATAGHDLEDFASTCRMRNQESCSKCERPNRFRVASAC